MVVTNVFLIVEMVSGTKLLIKLAKLVLIIVVNVKEMVLIVLEIIKFV